MITTTTRKLTKDEDRITQLINSEIEYCKEHPDKELSADFQKGFIRGLEQAERLVTINRIKYIPSERYALIHDISVWYVNKLCRIGKVDAIKLGNYWFIHE